MVTGIATLIFAAGFHREATIAFKTWRETTAYNYCFLIPAVVGYLLWERRRVIRPASPEPAAWPLALVALLAAAWLVAAALDVLELRQLLVVAMFEAVLLAALGLRLYRALLAPLLFLFFLVPIGDFLIPSLQSASAVMTVGGLRLLGIPVFSDGYVIDIPEGSFTVAEACAGLRFLIAASVFGCVFAVVIYGSWWRRAFFIALSMPTAIVANWLRVFGTLLLAHLAGSAAAVEADHIVYGYVFLSLVIALLIGIGLLLAQNDRTPASAQPLLRPREGPAPWWHAGVVPLAALLAVTGPAYAAWQNSLSAANPLPPIASWGDPLTWRPRPDGVADWRPLLHGADRESLENFDGPDGAVVTRYIALYRLRPTGNRLTSNENRVADGRTWRIVGQGRHALSLAGKRTVVASDEIASGERRRLVWSFYVVGGTITARPIEAKLLQFRAVWLQRAPVGGFVAVSASMDDPDHGADDTLARFLAANQNLPDYVVALSRPEGASGGRPSRAPATTP